MDNRLMRSVSVDCVIFGFDEDQLKVLLVERILKEKDSDNILFKDLTLTGYHIYQDENLDSAAARIVNDLTGLKDLVLEQFYTFGDLDRLNHKNDKLWIDQIGEDISDRVVSIGYFSLLPTTNIKITQKNRNVKWYSITDVENLAYDHSNILDKAIDHLRYKLSHEPIGFELLPTKFTISQMQKLYESIFDISYDKRNFRRKVSQMKFIVPLDEYQTAVANKPAQLYMFSRDVYEQTKKERTGFFFNY